MFSTSYRSRPSAVAHRYSPTIGPALDRQTWTLRRLAGRDTRLAFRERNDEGKARTGRGQPRTGASRLAGDGSGGRLLARHGRHRVRPAIRIAHDLIVHGPPLRHEAGILDVARDLAGGSALLVHGWSITEVPSASSLRSANPTCANMLLYWSLLERAVARGQEVFDLGRSTPGGPHFKFKEQWGARAHPAEWQFYARGGDTPDLRPGNPRYQRVVRLWKKLPVRVTRLVGPHIVRGIP